MTEKREEAHAIEKKTESTDTFALIPPHTHTPDEVAWDAHTDPTEPATIGHLLALHDRQTTIHRRLSETERAQRQLAVSILFLSIGCIVLAVRLRKVNHNG